ncbi:MAG TPA: L,D-transpeptidase family protein [Xanthobacteraceae bacterium]
MNGFRCDHILASAAVALLLAAPLCALAQETPPTPAEITGDSQASDAPAKSPVKSPAMSPATSPIMSGDEAPTSSATASAADIAPGALSAPVSVPQETPARDALPDALALPDASPDSSASRDPADRAIAERIRDLLATKADQLFVLENERAAVQAFYLKRNLAPLWLDKGAENARAKAVIARLKNADADGLDPGDYKTPSFAGLAADALAEADLALTQSVLTYARHVQAGRFPYRLVREDNIGLPQAAPDPAQALDKIAEAADAGKALDEFSPQHEPYQKLKAALAELRGRAAGGRDEIAAGPALSYSRKHPMEDPRVPALRDRLELAGEGSDLRYSDLRYDAKLAEAVKRFQRANGLPGTGNLDARTVRKLNHPTQDRRIETVIANMERWRWYPRDLGKAHVEVNEPDFTLKVLNEGRQVWASRIVIGKPSLPTPLLSETMNSITINPTWHVPPSIVHNEYLPAQARDPGVLARMGLRVSYSGGEVQITMPPGGENPLGHIRFNFFNRFMVYQHDTPDQYMFTHDVRAESHGCMRVQDAAKYAEVLSHIAVPDEQWTAEKVKSMYGSAEHEINLLQSVPIRIHLTYQTAFVDDAGKLQTRRDLYNLDSRTLAAIKSTRATLGPGPEQKHPPEIAAVTPAARAPAARAPAVSAPAAPAHHRRRLAHRAPQPAAYPPIFFNSETRYARPRPMRGIAYR